MPKISVIIPIYNSSKFLNNCIESLLAQSYKKFEIILVDDGSTDNSLDICKDYSENNNNILFFHKQNGGTASARNFGLNVATGDYISFIDSDDWIEYDMYETLIEMLVEYNADIAICNMYIHDNQEIHTSRKLDEPLEILENIVAIKKLFKSELNSSLADKLLKKTIFNGINFNENISFEDSEIMHKLLFESNRIVRTSSPKYHYVLNKKSKTKSKMSLKRLEDLIFVLEQWIFFSREKQYLELEILAIKRFIKTIISVYSITDNYTQMQERINQKLLKYYSLLDCNSKLEFKESLENILKVTLE